MCVVNAMSGQLTLLTPWALLFVIPVLIWGFASTFVWRGLPVIQVRHAFVDALLSKGIGSEPPFQRVGWLLTGIMLVVALSQPVWERASDAKSVALTQADMMVVVETSVTMLLQEQDGRSRLAQAQGVVQQLLDQRSAQARTGLLVFADNVYPVLPLTQDSALVTSMMMRLDAALAGREDSAALEAVQLAGWQISQDNADEQRQAWVVLVTDGAHAAARGQLEEVMRWLEKHAIRLAVVLVGADQMPDSASGAGLIYSPRHLGLVEALKGYPAQVVKVEDHAAMMALMHDLAAQQSAQVLDHTDAAKAQQPLMPILLVMILLMWMGLWWREGWSLGR